MDEFSKIIGKRVVEIRKKKNISQEELGLSANITRKSMYNIENGKVHVTAILLARICASLDITLSDFFSGINFDQEL